MHLGSLKTRFFTRQAEKQEVKQEKRQRTTTSVPAPPPSPPRKGLNCNLSLNNKGKLIIDLPDDAKMLDPLLKQTIAHDAMAYQRIASTPDRDRHVLLDKQGRLISLAKTDEGFIGITHSEKKSPAQKQKKPNLFHRSRTTQPPELSLSDEFVNVAGKKIGLPDKSLNEFLTDSTSDDFGRYRMHMKRLYRFNDTSKSWEPFGNQSEKKALLSAQADGKVWTITNDKTLSPVTPFKSGFESTQMHLDDIASGRVQRPDMSQPVMTFNKKVEHFCVSKEGQALVQTANDDDKVQSIHWIEDVTRPGNVVQVDLPHGFNCRKTAIFDKTVFALDYRGALHCAPVPSEFDRILHFDAAINKDKAQKITAAIANVVGDGFKFEEIMNVKDDRVHVVVKDSREQRHFVAVKMDRQNVSVESSWNITDSMTLDHQQGLTPFQPETKNVIDLDRLGKVTVYDNRPYFFNDRSGQWELTNEEKSDRLKLSRLRAGLDGLPWMIKDGGIKKLKIREGTNRLPESDNVFTLPHARKMVGIDQAMPGMDNDHHLKDVAPADSDNVVSLNNKGELNIHTGGANKLISKHDIAESASSANMTVSEIAFNRDNELILLSESADLYKIKESQWRSGYIHPIVPILPPRNEMNLPIKFIGIHTIAPGLVACEDSTHQLWVQTGNVWQKHETANIKSDVMTNRLEILNDDDHIHRIKGTGISIKSHLHLGGMEKQKKVSTPFKDRFDAFIFRPTMEWPRPLKNAAYGIQHRYKGREGLIPIYNMQKDLSVMIRQALPDAKTVPQLPLGITLSHLERYDATPDEKRLMSDINDFIDLLSASTNHYSKLIGKHYGFLDDELRPRARPKLRHRHSGLLNPASTRQTNLTQNLNILLNYFPLDIENGPGNLIGQMFSQNIVLNETKEIVPGGRNRDTHDEIGLIKSRLIHDALTIRHLHQLVDDIKEGIDDAPNRDEFIYKMTERTAALRFGLWDQNVVKAVTDQGFENLSTLEVTYDAIRSMVKMFSKENHGVNITARTVMDANDQDTLQQNLIDTLRSMETGESLSFVRGYGVNAAISSYFSAGFFVPGNVGGRMDRVYQMTLSRNESGFTVGFTRSMSTTGMMNVGLVDNLFATFDPAHPVFLDDDHQIHMSKTVLLGGSASLTGRDSKSTRLALHINESELQPFIEQLISGELDPIEMMNRGSRHQTQRTRSQDVNLSLSALASAYITLPFIPDSAQTVTAMTRVRAQAAASVTVAAGHRERSFSVTSAGTGSSRSDNRIAGFDRAGIAAQFALPMGPRFFSNGSTENLTTYVTPSVDFHASIDNRTNHKLKIDLVDASEITTREIDAITSRLDRYFTDNTSAQLIANIQRKSPDHLVVSPAEKLAILDKHFSQWYEIDNPDPGNRHDELLGFGHKSTLLALQSLVRTQNAALNRKQVIAGAEYQTTYKNVSRLDHNSFCHYLGQLTGFSHSDSNADRIGEMMRNDHHLSSFIDQLRENPHALATVTLEFNLQTRDMIERGWEKQSLTQENVLDLLKDRQNVRIKSVNFTQTVKKSDGFASPNFILGGSNSATVALTENLGSIHFSYTDNNQYTPATYTLKGRIASRENALTKAMDSARKAGYILKPTS